MDVSIIIVSYNSANYLKNCLKSIVNLTDNIRKEIIVVDNSSSDNTAEIVKLFAPQVKLIESKENLGFSGGNNLGAKGAQGEFILFLNPDTVVLNNSLLNMINYAKSNKKIGIIGAKLNYPDESLQLSCRSFYTLRTIIMRRIPFCEYFSSKMLKEHLMSDWDHNTIREVEWVLAACLMIKREILEEVGYLDERYRLYFEDVDLCYRVKQAGYKVCYLPNAKVIHYHQRESAKMFSMKTIWHMQSAIKFFNKFGWRF